MESFRTDQPVEILIVDDDYKAVSEKLRDALKELGAEKPRFIFNTHWHGDHTEGNQFFGQDSIIVAHANVRKRLAQTNTIFGETVQHLKSSPARGGGPRDVVAWWRGPILRPPSRF